MRRLATFWRTNYSDTTEADRFDAIASLISRHTPELAECEHGALKGRCLVDLCEGEDFESGDLINRAQSVADQCDDENQPVRGIFNLANNRDPLTDAINMHSFTAQDFRDLVAYAWVGARVLKAAGVESPHLHRT